MLSLGVNRDLLYAIRQQQRQGKLDGATVLTADRGIGAVSYTHLDVYKRQTFIGVQPYRTIQSRGSSIVIEERGKSRSMQGDIFALLKQLLAGHKPAHIPGLPPFTSGAVGFFAYDVVRQIERLPEQAVDDLGIPDACLMFFDEVLAFDHVRKQILLMVTADLSRQKPAAAYADAKQRLGRLEKRLARPIPKPLHAPPRGKLAVTSHTLKKDFLASVARIKEYIAAGDIFQAVLSQRFEVKPGVDPFSIYRCLLYTSRCV